MSATTPQEATEKNIRIGGEALKAINDLIKRGIFRKPGAAAEFLIIQGKNNFPTASESTSNSMPSGR